MIAHPTPAGPCLLEFPAPPQRTTLRFRWTWTFVLFPIAIPCVWQSLERRAPARLSIEKEENQMVIRWNPASIGAGWMIITDGENRMSLSIPARFASVTYWPHSSDVEVRLGRINEATPAEVTRFVEEPLIPADVAAQLGNTLVEAREVRGRVLAGTAHLTEMQEAADKLFTATQRTVVTNAVALPQ